MDIVDRLLAVVAPHDCIGCGAEGSLLCVACSNSLCAVTERCYRCRKLSPSSLTCTSCRKTSRLRRVQVATVYAGVAKELVWKLKFTGAQQASQPMVAKMSELIRDGYSPTTLIIPVPTATKRARQRGYDQAELLARGLTNQARLRYYACLARIGHQHQHGAARAQRLKQLASAFRVTRPQLLRGAHVLLIDDVVTTGATLEAAARVLKAAGADQIDAIVFAQP